MNIHATVLLIMKKGENAHNKRQMIFSNPEGKALFPCRGGTRFYIVKGHSARNNKKKLKQNNILQIFAFIHCSLEVLGLNFIDFAKSYVSRPSL